MSRYQNGLDKMVEVNKMVDDLKLMLIELMP